MGRLDGAEERVNTEEGRAGVKDQSSGSIAGSERQEVRRRHSSGPVDGHVKDWVSGVV